MKLLESAREVVDALGGIAAVAVRYQRKPTTVSAWQAKFGTFPPSTYVVMTDDLLLLGYTAPNRLWRQIGLAPDQDEELEEAADAS